MQLFINPNFTISQSSIATNVGDNFERLHKSMEYNEFMIELIKPIRG